MAGRPATGQTPPISFRPPVALVKELDELAKAEGRDRTDVLIEAAHDWIRKKRREQATAREQPEAT
ncbi:ribbon-helix-helix protein, CopG family [Kitasatospora sp. NPDC088134]|uniref:ribbon-helix-helix protein, CopG family n=1 Tax=Kitasatospora sp. NPDC088134 TaxID=3364071 RepID=UPI00380A4340